MTSLPECSCYTSYFCHSLKALPTLRDQLHDHCWLKNSRSSFLIYDDDSHIPSYQFARLHLDDFMSFSLLIIRMCRIHPMAVNQEWIPRRVQCQLEWYFCLSLDSLILSLKRCLYSSSSIPGTPSLVTHTSIHIYFTFYFSLPKKKRFIIIHQKSPDPTVSVRVPNLLMGAGSNAGC